MIDESPMQMSLPNSSDHLEVVKVLGFIYQYFLTQSTLPLIAIDYQPASVIDDFWEKWATREKLPRVGTSS